jgi:sensor histidine kinase YesM
MNDCFKRNKVLHHIKDLVIVVIIGVFTTWLFYFFNGVGERFAPQLHGVILYSLLIGGTLWKGNELVSYIIHRKINILEYPNRALWVSLTSMFFYSIFAIIIVNYLWVVFVFDQGFSDLFRDSVLITMISELVITIIISSIMYSIGFFKAWREAAVNEEKLKTEQIALQYKALKNQVNPHFLFNSLNTLSTLVYRDPDTAARFIKQLSEVYRYVLEHKDSELINVHTELEFVRKYLYLQKIRHGENLISEIKLEACKDCMILPLSLQMLVENSIKHNIVSKEEPLKISIFQEADYIVVQNNLQPRSTVEESEGIGLSNIRDRYNHISDKKFIIDQNNGNFTIKIPILKAK